MRKESALMLLALNLVIVLLVFLARLMDVQITGIHYALALILLVADFLLLLAMDQDNASELTLAFLAIAGLSIYSLFRGFGIIFLGITLVAVILLLVSIIAVANRRYAHPLPKPVKPAVQVYKDEVPTPRKAAEKEKAEPTYTNFYDVDELVKESQELARAERYIEAQMDSLKEAQAKEQEPQFRIITKSSAKRSSRKQPAVAKKRKRTKPRKYAASKSGKRFHKLGCMAIKNVKPKDLVRFGTPVSAKNKGFKACPMCLGK